MQAAMKLTERGCRPRRSFFWLVFLIDGLSALVAANEFVNSEF